MYATVEMMPRRCRGGTARKVNSPYIRRSTDTESNQTSVVYNMERDIHHAELTVRQTLQFALQAQTLDKASGISGESRSGLQRIIISVISKLFWIEPVLDTKIGNELIPGVSLGVKKRVSLAEAMIAGASTQCWDDPTKGLDASTALQFVRSLRRLTNVGKISTVVALYQASESLLNSFDKVMLIVEGKCAYFGPTQEAKAYFEGLGFECPPRWTTAAFLKSVTDRHSRHIKTGWENRIPRSGDDFQQAYRNTDVCKAALADVEDFEKEAEFQRRKREEARRGKPQKTFIVPFYRQVLTLTHRQYHILVGDRPSLAAKFGVIIWQAIVIGSLFYNLPRTRNGFPSVW